MNLKYKYEVIQDYPAVSASAPVRPVINQQTEQIKEELEQMELRNMKIGQRLFAGFGIELLLMAALGIVSYLQKGTI